MALDWKICKVGKSADCSTIFIEDQTVYGTTPDARTDYALFLAGFYYNKDGDDTRLTIDNTLPETVSTWEVTSFADGYHYFDLLSILIWKSGLSFSIGDICYENTFYWKALTNNSAQQPTNTEGLHWEKVADPYLESGNLNDAGDPVIDDITRYDDTVLCRADICYGEVVANAAENCCDDCAKATSGDYMRVDVLIQSAYLLTAQTKYTEAHEVATLLADVCNDLSDCGCS